MSEYQRVVKDSSNFRAKYAYKMQEIIDGIENGMRKNIEIIENSVQEYAQVQGDHLQELMGTIG